MDDVADLSRELFRLQGRICEVESRVRIRLSPLLEGLDTPPDRRREIVDAALRQDEIPFEVLSAVDAAQGRELTDALLQLRRLRRDLNSVLRSLLDSPEARLRWIGGVRAQNQWSWKDAFGRLEQLCDRTGVAVPYADAGSLRRAAYQRRK